MKFVFAVPHPICELGLASCAAFMRSHKASAMPDAAAPEIARFAA
jgi:hypothetical protein